MVPVAFVALDEHRACGCVGVVPYISTCQLSRSATGLKESPFDFRQVLRAAHREDPSIEARTKVRQLGLFDVGGEVARERHCRATTGSRREDDAFVCGNVQQVLRGCSQTFEGAGSASKPLVLCSVRPPFFSVNKTFNGYNNTYV